MRHLAVQSLSEPPPGNFRHLGLQWFAPPPSLLPWVQCYWVAQLPLLSSVEFNENLYPDGGTSLCIDFRPDNLPLIHFNAYHQTSQMRFSSGVDRMGIRFHPGGAFQLLGLEMSDLMGTEHDIDDLGISSLIELRETLMVAGNIPQRVWQCDNWLLQLAAQASAHRGMVQHLLHQIAVTREPIEILSNKMPISRRQLERKFQLEVGMAPAQIKQLHRVKQARIMISRQPELPLAQVALDTGFYDQAHFIRQFQKVTGQTPGKYREKKMSQKYNPT